MVSYCRGALRTDTHLNTLITNHPIICLLIEVKILSLGQFGRKMILKSANKATVLTSKFLLNI